LSTPSDEGSPPAGRRPTPATRPGSLEHVELLHRREATRRAIHRNASQARGELERGEARQVLKITALMLRGKNLRTLAEPQIPLVYYRGRAFEELGEEEAAAACYRALAAWDGGSHPIVDDARDYIDLGLERLLDLLGEPTTGPAGTSPQRDPRVFPRPYLTAARLVAAVGVFVFGTLCAGVVLAFVAAF
jgi:hypothetical protein